MAKQMSLLEFQARFPDEESCVRLLMDRRWPDGFACPKCGSRKAILLTSRANTYACGDCGSQTSATAGTVMHGTKLPLTTWFWAAHLMATHSNGMSARQLVGQLGIGSYKTAWLLEQKLRRSMVDPNRDPLEGVVEIDQTEMPFRANTDADSPLKSGKILIVGAVEVIDHATGKPHKPKGHGARYLDTLSGRIRLAAIPSNEAVPIHAFIKANIAPGATLLTDGHASYPGLEGYRHDPRVVGSMAAHVALRWIHRVFALLKRWSLGTYHGLRPQHIAAYLDEFVFRYNRRFYRHVSFQTILGLASQQQPTSYWDIIGRQNPRIGVEMKRKSTRRRKTAAGLQTDGTGPRPRQARNNGRGNGPSG